MYDVSMGKGFTFSWPGTSRFPQTQDKPNTETHERVPAYLEKFTLTRLTEIGNKDY